jgi:hypothetical protein
MTSFPGSPRLQKGAIVGIDPFNPVASIIVFQYNPDTLTRRLQARSGGDEEGDRAEALRLKGPPVETISLAVEVDATDQLAAGDGLAMSAGIYPQLASLEMLLYPKSALIIANVVLAAVGTIEVLAPEAPLTLFVWGLKRVVPVRLTEFSITEEAFDTQLNPIRAKVDLSLRVLTYQDLGLLSVGGALSMAHQIAKEVMATIHGVGSIAGSGSVSIGASIG